MSSENDLEKIKTKKIAFPKTTKFEEPNGTGKTKNN
jgi:hypothetical protein